MATLFDDIEIEEPAAPVVPGSLAERMPPRDYQEEALAEFARAYLAGERKMMFRLATGTGKTFTACLAAEHWLSLDPMNRVMVLAYERGLVTQFHDEIAEFLPGVSLGMEMSSDAQVSRNALPLVTVASRQTLYIGENDQSRLYKFDPEKYNWLIVPDECHGWKYGLKSCRPIVDWFEQNPNSAWLGLTATPERGDGVSLKRLFGHNCCELRLGDAIDQGYLVPLRQKYIQVEGVDFKNLREVAGDFDDSELDEILSEREQLLAMAVPLLETVGNRRTLIFCPGVNCAKALARTITAEIAARGLPHGGAQSMDGSTPEDQRRAIIDGHQRGDFQFLVVCGLCRAGYNDPGLGCVAVFRPTKSRVMAEQMKGRGVRTLRGTLKPGMTAEERRAAIAASDKPYCLIIDLVGVSGIPEVASTAHLLASGEADEVVDRANKRLVESGEDESIEDAIAKSKAEIKEEREAARLARLERERKDREEAERRARLRAEVKYHTRDVAGIEDAGDAHDPRPIESRPTPKQVAALVRMGWSRASAERLTKRQASGVIGKARSAQPDRSPIPSIVNPGDPPTAKQVAVLERHGKPVPETFREAAQILTSIRWGGRQRV